MMVGRRAPARGDWRRSRCAASSPPLRCPSCITGREFKRLHNLDVPSARKYLRDGEAFVCSAPTIVGELLGWDFEHLARPLPPASRYGVHRVRERLVMSHSVRYSGGQLPVANDVNQPFSQTEVSFMTFKEFLEATDRFERTRVGGRPYLGLDLLRRSSKQQEGYETQNLGEQLTAELRTFQSGRLEPGMVLSDAV